MRRADLIAAAIVLALAVWAVVAQLTSGDGPQAPDVPVLEVSEALPLDVVLKGLDGEQHRLGDLLGEKGTVLYSWSTTCPCIPWCQDELNDIQSRYGPEQGIAWVAVVGEPTDTPEGIRATMEKIGATYTMVLDPSHRLCGRMGFDRAAIVAVLDADGYLRFRGNPSDDLKDPTRWFLNDVLEAVAAGKRPGIESTKIYYGCEFSEPIECEDDVVESTGRTKVDDAGGSGPDGPQSPE